MFLIIDQIILLFYCIGVFFFYNLDNIYWQIETENKIIAIPTIHPIIKLNLSQNLQIVKQNKS